MLRWVPYQFKAVWSDLYQQCDRDTQETLDARMDLLLELGNRARRPVSEHLGNGIFELRAKNVRMLFYFGPERTIIFVHGITKKRRDVPRTDIELAERRRRMIVEGMETPYDFSN